MDVCSSRPELFASGTGRQARCFRWQEIDSGTLEAGRAPILGQARMSEMSKPGLVLDIDQLEVGFPHARTLGRMGQSRPVKSPGC
jgi:hypothetical protein